MTASGCGATVKEYGHLLAHDPAYRDKAARISALTKDLCEVVQPKTCAANRQGPASPSSRPARCSTASRCAARSRRCSRAAGYELTPVADAHLCCGSAGTYSILQPELSGAAARAQARRAAGRRARGDRHRQHRLPRAPAGAARRRRYATGSSCSTKRWQRRIPHGNAASPWSRAACPHDCPDTCGDAGDGEGRRRGEDPGRSDACRSPTARCAPRSRTTSSAPMRPTACCIR